MVEGPWQLPRQTWSSSEAGDARKIEVSALDQSQETREGKDATNLSLDPKLLSNDVSKVPVDLLNELEELLDVLLDLVLERSVERADDKGAVSLWKSCRRSLSHPSDRYRLTDCGR